MERKRSGRVAKSLSLRRLFIAGFFYSLFWAGASCAAEITVAAAANVQVVLNEWLEVFRREYPQIEVKVVLASSGSLSAQIENGAPFDIFLSADMGYPQALQKKGWVVGDPAVYAYGKLVLWSLKDFPLTPNLEVLKEPAIKKIAVASPETAPYGRQAVAALRFRHLYEAVQSKLVYGESIAHVNHFVMTGAADVGLTAKSAVLAAQVKGQGRWVDLDPLSYEPIAQGVAVLKQKKNDPLSVQAFFNFIFSESARGVLEKYGYGLP